MSKSSNKITVTVYPRKNGAQDMNNPYMAIIHESGDVEIKDIEPRSDVITSWAKNSCSTCGGSGRFTVRRKNQQRSDVCSCAKIEFAKVNLKSVSKEILDRLSNWHKKTTEALKDDTVKDYTKHLLKDYLLASARGENPTPPSDIVENAKAIRRAGYKVAAGIASDHWKSLVDKDGKIDPEKVLVIVKESGATESLRTPIIAEISRLANMSANARLAAIEQLKSE